MNYRLRAYSLQDIGQRPGQQDCFYPPFQQPCQFSEIDRDMVYYDGAPHTDDRLFILCDGMGGHDFGEVASQTVTIQLSRFLLNSSSLEGEFDDSLLQKAADAAQKALSSSKEGSSNMGTTMAVLKFHASGATIGHIGDSRVYQFRPAKLDEPAHVVFCTRDHHLPDRTNVLTRAMMAYNRETSEVEIDHITDIRPDDIFMLCSDGIVENLKDDRLCALLTNPNYDDPERVQRLLLECKDHRDNHTAIIIRVRDVLNSNPLTSSFSLPKGTVLQGANYAYHIDKKLGKGAFGITYLAEVHIDMKGQLGSILTSVKVCIKEFAMETCMKRVGNTLEIVSDRENVEYFQQKFRQEATKIALLSHPNIVRILEVFEANGTVYYAMEYMPDGNLGDYAQMKMGLPERKAIHYIRQVGSALSYIHANHMLHLDVKSDNVMMQGPNTVKLIDFGIARNFGKDGDLLTGKEEVVGTRGFAPPEQVDKNFKFGFFPEMDVYALGATYYHLLTASPPNCGPDVAKSGLDLQPLRSKSVSKKSIEAIKTAMQPDLSKRPKAVDDFLAMLPSLDEANDFVAEENKKSFPWKLLLGILLLIVVFLVFALLLRT